MCNEGDKATHLTSRYLVAPLAEALADRCPDWRIETVLAGEASKARLAELLNEKAPALLFTASHGLSFPAGDPRQASHQGALVCQDWPGPEQWHGRVPEEHCFSGQDVTRDADLTGLIAFCFGCHTGGVGRYDAFACRDGWTSPHGMNRELAPHDLVARLPQVLLRRGALAAVGHIDRAWGYSYLWPGVGQQIQTFEASLTLLLGGLPVGLALSHFGARYSELSATLNAELERARRGDDPDGASEDAPDDSTLVRLWTAVSDARGQVIFGDPATRLAPEEQG